MYFKKCDLMCLFIRFKESGSFVTEKALKLKSHDGLAMAKKPSPQRTKGNAKG